MTDTQKLNDLLAIIHRDGGHYRAKHGDDQAYVDAIALITNERAETQHTPGQSEAKGLEAAKWETRWSRDGLFVELYCGNELLSDDFHDLETANKVRDAHNRGAFSSSEATGVTKDE